MKKKFLVTSVLVILMCASLIGGATFALFTSEQEVDIAVTSGKVDVEATIENLNTYSMENENATVGAFENGGTAKFDDSKALILENLTCGDKATFEVKIVNDSNINASYRIRAYVEGELENALVIKATIDNKEVVLSDVQFVTDWVRFNGKETIVVPMSVLLPLDCGNDAQGLSAKVTFAVEAVQANAAGTIYVDGKSYESIDEAIAVAGANGTIQISGSVQLQGIAGTSQVRDLQGVTIEGLDYATLVFVNAEGSTTTGTCSFANVNLKNLTVVDETFYYGENGENAWEFTYLEFDGENTFNNVIFTDGIFIEGGNSNFTECSFIGHNNDSTDKGNTTMYGAWVYSGEATFTKCDFTGTRGLKVADQYSGSDVTDVTVDKCSFGPLSEKPGIAVDNRNGSLNLLIKDSTFKGTQPGDGKDNSANGVPYVYENDNRTPDTTTITLQNCVYPVEVNSVAEMSEAIKDGAKTLVLGSGDYTIPVEAKGKELTIVGNGDTTINVVKIGNGGENVDGMLDGSKVVFENVTIKTNSSTYIGYARLNATYNNCTFDGTYTLYGNSEFNNCTFNVSGDVYNIWTWGAPNATFNNCTFNSDGKAMLLYSTVNTNLTINNCTFNDKGGLTDKKAAIEIGNDYSTSYTLTVNNTVVNGYEINDKGTNTGTTLWGNKNAMSQDVLNVVVDGVDVY